MCAQVSDTSVDLPAVGCEFTSGLCLGIGPSMRGEDKEINAQPMSPAGKKRQLVESGGGARKKAVNSPSLENSCSVRSFLKPMDGGTAADTVFEFKSGDDASAQHVELNYDEQTGTVALDDSADESDPICLKRKRSLRVTTLNHLRSGREQSIRANTRGCSQKSRADAQKKISEPNREPSVILAWKHRCMYENDGEEIDTLVNKRDDVGGWKTNVFGTSRVDCRCS